MKVGIFGNSYWAERLARSFEASLVSARQLYVGEEHALKSWSLSRWLTEERSPWSCDVLHVIGRPKLWRLWLAARLKGLPVVLHWIGSDVSSFLLSPRLSRVAGPLLNAFVTCHLAGAENLRRELRTYGVYARCEPLGLASFADIKITPLPEKPCCLAMLRPDKFEFYGGLKVLEIARAAPDIRWLVVAHNGEGLPKMANVEYLGDVADMESVYRGTTVLVRLTDHDGTGMMPIEALARGRHVVWSQRRPCCRFAETAGAALEEIRAVIRLQCLNLGGARFVRKAYDATEQAMRLRRLYSAVVGESFPGPEELD